MSYDFDGSGAANLNVATPIAAMPLTMACWFKIDTDGEGHTFICLGNAANQEIFRLGASMDVGGDPVVFRATTDGGSQSNVNTTAGATLSTWYHACCVASGSTNRAVYLNGANKASVSAGTRTISAATRLAIGSQYQAGTYGADTNGKVAHVAIWDVALSDGEVAALAAGANPLTIQPDHLIAYWPLTADLVDLVDGLTLTNGGGATLSGDNPTVAAPPGSGASEGALSSTIGDIALAASGVGPGSAAEGSLDAGLGEISLSATGSGYTMPTLSRPPGGGDVDVAATVITDGYTATPTIELFGDPENNENISGARWEGFYATVDLKQTGRTPTFKLDFSNWRQSTPPTNNRLYWRYGSDIGDMAAWVPFDSRSVSGSVLTFSKSGAFAEAVVQIANIPPVPYAELEDWLTTWDANGRMFRPQACAALGVSGSAPNKYAYYDFPDLVSPDGIEVGSTYAFAFGVTNPEATGPKKRLFHTWTHAGEWGGLRAMLRFAERLMSIEDADHDVLRDDFEHVFLITNTAGMVGGMARGAAESGDVGDDPNRAWGSNPIERGDVADPILSIEASVALLVAEWGVDGANRLQCAGQIAWHSHTFSNTKFGTYKDGMSAAEAAFIGYIEGLYGSSLHNYGASSTSSSTAFARSGTTGGFGITFEWSYAFADFLNEIGASADTIAPALVDAYGAGWFGLEGSFSGLIGDFGFDASGALAISGALTGGIGAIALSAAAEQDNGGELISAIGEIAVSAIGALALSGTCSASIGSIALEAAGEGIVTGSGALSASIGGIGLSATGVVAVSGEASLTIGAISLASASRIAITGALSAAIGGISVSANGAGSVNRTGVVAATLDAITVAAAGELHLSGALSVGIGTVTLAATNIAGVASPTPPERRAAATGESRRAAA